MRKSKGWKTNPSSICTGLYSKYPFRPKNLFWVFFNKYRYSIYGSVQIPWCHWKIELARWWPRSWLKVTPWYLDRTEDRLTILIKEHPKQICASKRILAVQMRTRTWWAHFLLPKFSHFVLYIPYYFIFSIFRFTSIFGSVRIPWCHFWPRSWPPSSEFDLSANAYGNFSTMSPEADFRSSTNQFAKT